MSRTIRQRGRPSRWIMAEVTHANNVKNGYSTELPPRRYNVWTFDLEREVRKDTTDNMHRNLHAHKTCEGGSNAWLFEASSMLGKRDARRTWAKDNRRLGKRRIIEQLRDELPETQMAADGTMFYVECESIDHFDGYPYDDYDEPLSDYEDGWRDGYAAAMRMFAEMQLVKAG